MFDFLSGMMKSKEMENAMKMAKSMNSSAPRPEMVGPPTQLQGMLAGGNKLGIQAGPSSMGSGMSKADAFYANQEAALQAADDALQQGSGQTGLLGQIGGGLQALGGNEKAMEALGGLGGGSEPQPFVDMLSRGQAPAPMQAPASPIMPQSADPYMQMLMKMIGGAYG
jgi:hypothetical protein